MHSRNLTQLRNISNIKQHLIYRQKHIVMLVKAKIQHCIHVGAVAIANRYEMDIMQKR